MPHTAVKKEIHESDYQTQIAVLIERLQGTAGLYIHGGNGRIHLAHNPDLLFPAASLIKLPIFLEYLNRVGTGDLEPSREIDLSKGLIVGGHGVLKYAPPASVHALGKIARLMLTVSDNTAANILIDLLGMDRINSTARALGMKDTLLQRKMMDFDRLAAGMDNYTTPRDIYTFMNELLHPKIICPETGLELMNILRGQKINTKIPSPLPASTVVAHKTGELEGVEHDAGLIFTERQWSVFVILTKDLENNADGVSFCREVASLVLKVISGRSEP